MRRLRLTLQCGKELLQFLLFGGGEAAFLRWKRVVSLFALWVSFMIVVCDHVAGVILGSTPNVGGLLFKLVQQIRHFRL